MTRTIEIGRCACCGGPTEIIRQPSGFIKRNGQFIPTAEIVLHTCLTPECALFDQTVTSDADITAYAGKAPRK
ncbi:MAG: hypothetical protein K8L99_26205 [Anaerolineae bacterium]|nr:hypothetical protein [Anaerolineae bacterium]